MPDLKNTLGAFHVSELFFVFGNEDGRRCSIVSRKCLEYLMTSPWLTENVYLSNKNAWDIREINGDSDSYDSYDPNLDQLSPGRWRVELQLVAHPILQMWKFPVTSTMLSFKKGCLVWTGGGIIYGISMAYTLWLFNIAMENGP